MSPSSFGKHASGATSSQPALPEPSFAERARTLMHWGSIGSLSTQSRKQPGFPFGSLMPYALDGHGRPIFLISTMAMHTQNLQGDPRASLFVTDPGASGDPLGSSRVTLIGTVSRMPEPELAAARTVYLTGYPDSKYWVDFDDFFFYRMDVLDVYYVGGFGVMAWVAASDYSQAQSDPLFEHKSDIMQHMNADHKDALILLAKRFAGIEAQEAEMTSVDRLGFHLRLKTQDGMTRSPDRILAGSERSVRDQRSFRRDGTAGASRVGRLAVAVDHSPDHGQVPTPVHIAGESDRPCATLSEKRTLSWQ